MLGAERAHPARLRAVAFDYGGVLTSPVHASIQAWLAREDIDPRSFSRTLRAWLSRNAPDGTPVHRLETGTLAVEQFDALLAAELVRRDGAAVDPVGVLARLFSELRPDAAMLELVQQLREAGLRVALLSNSWGNAYPRAQLDALFDPVVISGEVGLRKPLAPIYELTLARLGLPAEQVLFIDDAEPNVLGARAVGMRALLHVDAATTRAALGDLLALPAAVADR